MLVTAEALVALCRITLPVLTQLVVAVPVGIQVLAATVVLLTHLVPQERAVAAVVDLQADPLMRQELEAV